MPSETITFIPFFDMYKKLPKKRGDKFPFFRPQFHVYTSAYVAVPDYAIGHFCLNKLAFR